MVRNEELPHATPPASLLLVLFETGFTRLGESLLLELTPYRLFFRSSNDQRGVLR